MNRLASILEALGGLAALCWACLGVVVCAPFFLLADWCRR